MWGGKANKPGKGDRSRRKLEAEDLDEAVRLPKDHLWAEKIPEARLKKELTTAFWEDPEPGSTGVLTADRIRAYHYAVGRMIRPFQEEHLNPASYDLTLGPRCVLDGAEKVLDGKRRILRIPPGSIAMVTSRELLLIPHWLVATFNLKSRYIFDGLLMGVGPQIDPGFMGVLTCPLHNISNHEVALEICQPFAKLDFVKTTWGTSIDLKGIHNEEGLYEFEAENRLTSKADRELVKLWPRFKNFRPPVSHLAGSEGAKSSLHRLEEDFERVRTRVRWGTLGLLGTVIALIGIFAALVAMSLVYTDGRIADVRDDNAATVRAEVKQLLREEFAEKARSRQTITSP